MKKQIILGMVVILIVTGVTSGITIAQNETQTTTQKADTTSVIKLDNTLTITDYKFENNDVTIWIEADYSRMIVLSAPMPQTEGASQIPRKEMTLDKGANKITMNVHTFKGYQFVSVASADGAVAISKKVTAGGITYQFESEQFIIGTILSFLGGVALVGGITIRKRDKYDSEPERKL